MYEVPIHEKALFGDVCMRREVGRGYVLEVRETRGSGVFEYRKHVVVYRDCEIIGSRGYFNSWQEALREGFAMTFPAPAPAPAAPAAPAAYQPKLL